jgi:hypothetical protein
MKRTELYEMTYDEIIDIYNAEFPNHTYDIPDDPAAGGTLGSYALRALESGVPIKDFSYTVEGFY